MNAPLVDLRISDDVVSRVRLAHVSAAPVRVETAGLELRDAIDRTCREIRERYGGRTPGEIEELRAARTLYRSFGIDPTKTRPSSEALVRRILKDKPFPSVLNAVDVSNLCAVRSHLPLGLYDTDKIPGSRHLSPRDGGGIVRRHSEARHPRRGPPVLCRRSRPVRKSDLRLTPHLRRSVDPESVDGIHRARRSSPRCPRTRAPASRAGPARVRGRGGRGDSPGDVRLATPSADS